MNASGKQKARAAIASALQQMARDQQSDPLVLLQALIACVRPPRHRLRRDAMAYWAIQMELLREEEALRLGLRNTILRLFASRRQVSFYADSGLLPDSGFFSELGRIITHKILPELRDTSELKACVAELFPGRASQHWLATIPLEERRQFWLLINLQGAEDGEALQVMVGQMLEAALVLSHRIAAMGLMPELARVYPRLKQSESPFVAMNIELAHFVTAFRSALEGKGQMDSGEHLFVLLEQCEESLHKIHSAASRLGTSLPLSFTLRRMEQHLERLRLLLRFMTVKVDSHGMDDLSERWSDFLMSAMEGERKRNSIGQHFSELVSLMALRVTDNAAHTGEHYIASNRKEWFSMLYRAAGAGVLIALLAFLKIRGASLHLDPGPQAWLNASIYAWGFAIIYMLRFVIATKQPAMTAATLAGSISQSSGRLRDTEKIVVLMVDTFRSQLAAVAGNIMVAFPLAIFFLAFIHTTTGQTYISVEKAERLLQDVRPLMSLSLLYAAVAGVWLFMAGLVSGYLDNRAIYMQLGPRIAQLHWLRFVLRPKGARAVGAYIESHAGGLGGNIFFGLMLGLTPLMGSLLGLQLDIRHIAFSSANVGYALVAMDFHVPGWLLLSAVSGVLLIGLVNLSVSFALALWVAMRSRKLSFWLLMPVMPRFFHRLRQQPGSFFLPPPADSARTG